MAGDARALLGDWLFRNLNKYLLTFVKKIADCWRAAALRPSSGPEIRPSLIRSARVASSMIRPSRIGPALLWTLADWPMINRSCLGVSSVA